MLVFDRIARLGIFIRQVVELENVSSSLALGNQGERGIRGCIVNGVTIVRITLSPHGRMCRFLIAGDMLIESQ